MKEKVLTLLKTSYAKYGFKAKEMESLAEIIATNLNEESTDEEIEAAISGAEVWAGMIQKVATRAASEIEKKYSKDPKPVQKEPANETTELEKMVKELKDQMAKMNADQQAAALKKRLLEDKRLSKVPSSFIAKYSIEKEDDLDAVVAKIDTEFTEMKSEMLKSGLIVDAPNHGMGGNNKPATAEEIKTLVSGL